jgi:hypothetical protein
MGSVENMIRGNGICGNEDEAVLGNNPNVARKRLHRY